jgi:myo-inositol-1(or 4)-monophosphatase
MVTSMEVVKVQTRLGSDISDHTDADVQRIYNTLICVAQEIAGTDMLGIEMTRAANGDPTTTLDHKINDIIRNTLHTDGEGWLSEESKDDPKRLNHSRVWIVDPIDGTREFVEGIPEWAVSIGLAVDHEAVAGGVLNPCTGELFLGSLSEGLKMIQLKGSHSDGPRGKSNSVLVSRSEYNKGKWSSMEEAGLPIKPVGSIAYRLARVAAGLDPATCTFETRSEWDVAAGVALMYASGGRVQTGNEKRIQFNNEVPLLKALFAFGENCPPAIEQMLGNQTVRPSLSNG